MPIKTYPVPTSVRIEPEGSHAFDAQVLGLVAHGVWVQTSEVLAFRRPVRLTFDPVSPHALSVGAEVVSVVEGALGFEVGGNVSERIGSVMLAWADGRAATLEGNTVPPPPPRASPTRERRGLRPLVGKLVVVVEDEPAVARLLQVALEKRGAVVVVFRTPREAIAFIQEHRVSAVLLDWMLPGGTGAEVLQALARAGDPPPVAVVSGVMSVGATRQEAKLRGARMIFSKPFRLSQICDWVEDEAR